VSGRAFDVLLNEQHIGWLSENDASQVTFRFTEPYRALGRRPILSQSFEDDLSRTYSGRKPGELPSFFANLLPEGRFRELLEKSLRLGEGDDLGLLAAVAEDLPGAITLRPAAEPAPTAEQYELEGNGNGGGKEIEFRFSLAGVQLKFSVVRQDDKLALPSHGNRGDWIVKVGTHEYPGLAENEYSVMQWAKAAGFDVPDIELRDASEIREIQKYAPAGSRVLAVKRFDREGEQRVHQEDFMQAFGWSPAGERKYKATYEEVASVVHGLLGVAGYEEFVRRLTFVVASGNNDAHLKNWSLLYSDGITPTFTPMYDQVATVAWEKLDRELALKFAGARDFSRVSIDSFRRLARKVEADEERTTGLVRETLASTRQTWAAIKDRMPIPEEHKRAIAEHWERVPILREAGSLR